MIEDGWKRPGGRTRDGEERERKKIWKRNQGENETRGTGIEKDIILCVEIRGEKMEQIYNLERE